MNEEKYFVYVLKSKIDSTIYIGCTSDINKRIFEHNHGLSTFTKSRIPWILIWNSEFFDKYKAFEFEKYLKTASGKAFLRKRLI